MSQIKFKVCGLKYPKNQELVGQLPIDYAGFIFYKNSTRYTKQVSDKLPESVKKVGVFVDEKLDFVLQKVKEFSLDVIQLHGNEDPNYIEILKNALHEKNIFFVQIWKAIPIKNASDIKKIELYNKDIDVILLDAKGKHPGGNGVKFDWDLLQSINSTTPVMLSGGIKVDDVETLNEINRKNLIWGIDLNSGFEINPGLKDPGKIKHFINRLN